MKEAAELFAKLVQIVAKLRNPQGGCPWDLEQTHESLKPYVIEEAYEVVEAIEEQSGKLAEELGDLLLQVVLHAELAAQSGDFNICDVIKGISDKLVKRHPHVFGAVKVHGSEQVLKNWEQLKKSELAEGQSILDGVPRGMPALQRAQRLGEKAARVGFDWHDARAVEEKITEEIAELRQAHEKSTAAGAGLHDAEQLSVEFGDLLFVLAQWGRKAGLDPEQALHKANNKFAARFRHMEKHAAKALSEYSLPELEELWQAAKHEERLS